MFGLTYQLLAFSPIFLSVVTAQTNVVSLAIAAQPTSGASGIISPSFAGFGIEPSNLYSFTGGTQQNDLSINLLNNLAAYAGTPPHFRIGGNTQDYIVYDDSMNDYVVKNNPSPTGQGAFAPDSMVIGPKFFEVLNRFPQNSPITFGLNLAYVQSDYINKITSMATQAVKRLTNLNLVGFEIGNEPDLYLQNGFRTGSWGGQVYTQQWLDRASNIWQQVLKPNNLPSNFFEPGATASTIGTSFQINDLDSFGITAKLNGSSQPYISTWNQHDYYYYIGVSTYPLTVSRFMTLSTTNDQFAAWVSQIQQAAKTDFPYALREMGVVGPIGMDEVTNVFGAALWTLNFFFYAATLNISSVQMHMTDNSNASAWQPIPYYDMQPHVRPNYYAFAAFSQTIGPTCQARIGGYTFAQSPSGYDGRIAAYSVYQGEDLASVVLINSMPANVSQLTKDSLTFDLSLPTKFAGQKLYLAYLTNTGADAKFNTTFNGISFEQSSDGTATVVNSTQPFVTIGNDGSAIVTLRDSEAVICNIGSPVGQLKSNPSACSALSQGTPDAKQGSATTSSAASASSTNAASSTTTSAQSSPTNGVAGMSKMMLGVLTSAFLTCMVLFA